MKRRCKTQQKIESQLVGRPGTEEDRGREEKLTFWVDETLSSYLLLLSSLLSVHLSQLEYAELRDDETGGPREDE